MRIQHNMRSANANRVLKASNLSRTKAMERLSSGYKINRAADDAAGLAISEKMRSQIRGLNKAARNVEDGISYVQVADGSLEEVQQMLHRIHELAVQAANGTNVDADRTEIDNEVQQLKSEIGDIFENTEFNTKKIWKGEPFLVEVIAGTAAVNGISIPAYTVTNNITNTNKEAFPKSTIRVTANSSGLSFYWDGYNNGVRYTTDVIPWEKDPTGSHTYNIADYMDKTKYPELQGINFQYGYTASSEAKLEDIIRSLNGRTISAYESSYESVVFPSGVSNRISGSASINYVTELLSDRNFEITDKEFIEGIKAGGVYSNRTPQSGDSDPLEFTFNLRNLGTVKAQVGYVSYSGNDRSDAGENIWWQYYTSNGVQRVSSLSYRVPNGNGSLNDLLYALNNGTNASYQSPQAPTDGTVTISMNLYRQVPANGTTTNIGSLTIRINLKSTDTPDTVRAIYDSLTGVDIDASTTKSTYRIYNSALEKAGDVITHTYAYEYERRGRLVIQAGANEGQILALDYPVMSNEYLGIESLSVDRQDDAEHAITVAQEAVQKVSHVRSLFGAFQNRLEHTLEYNKNAAENLQNAESRLRDADYAEEMVALSKNNILVEMGQQILSMSNSDPESVLNLLR